MGELFDTARFGGTYAGVYIEYGSEQNEEIINPGNPRKKWEVNDIPGYKTPVGCIPLVCLSSVHRNENSLLMSEPK